MANGSLIKGLIGKEDLSIQTNSNAPETYTRTSSTGGTTTLYKIPDLWSNTGAIRVGDIVTKGPWVDPRAFGAVGDGNTDDTTAIQDAYTYAGDNNLPVFITAGTYLITTILNVPANVTVVGTRESVLKGDAVIGCVLNLSGSNIIQGITIDCGNTFDGSEITMAGAYDGIRIKDCSENKIINCEIKNFGSPYDGVNQGAGVYIYASALGNYVDNNSVIGCDITGFNIPYASAPTLSNHAHHCIRIENLGGSVEYTPWPSDFTWSDANYIRNTRISGNKLTYGNYGVLGQHTNRLMIYDNIFSYQSRCVYLGQKTHGFQVNNNKFFHVQTCAVGMFYGIKDGVVSANYCEGTTSGDSSMILAYYGISHVNITGNILDSKFEDWAGPDTRSPGAGINIGTRIEHINISENIIRGFLYGIRVASDFYGTDSALRYNGFRQVKVSGNRIFGDYFGSASGYKADFLAASSVGLYFHQPENYSDNTKGWTCTAEVIGNTIDTIEYSFLIATTTSVSYTNCDFTGFLVCANTITNPSGNAYPDFQLHTGSQYRQTLKSSGNSWNFLQQGTAFSSSGLGYGEEQLVMNPTGVGYVHKYYFDAAGTLRHEFVGGTSADIGDNNTTYTVGTTATTILYNTQLTGNKTVTLGTTNAAKGDKVRVIRNAGTPGAFTLDVGGLKTISSGKNGFVDVEFNGSAWVLTAWYIEP